VHSSRLHLINPSVAVLINWKAAEKKQLRIWRRQMREKSRFISPLFLATNQHYKQKEKNKNVTYFKLGFALFMISSHTGQ